MPKDTTIHSILVIGSGPIVIGQAAEFDYAGTQACSALKEDGYEVILVNDNPATIMSDNTFADHIYFEPLTVDVIEKIIAKENPDGMLATLGGQTGLNLAFQLHESGILEKYGVKLLGSSIDSIKKGEDREAFRELMNQLKEPVPESTIVHELSEAIDFANEIGFPIIVRPAYTLGGTGGGIADSVEQLTKLVTGGLNESAIHQCLIEKSIAGYKEIEYEVMRDASNNCIVICNMENIDPVGIHTGDSIVVAPTQTLTDEENQMLKAASIKIVSALGVIGGCNIQFALDPYSKNYYLIEVNPRVSRSSALASKATGYPIARMAAKLSIGYLLDEIVNPMTGTNASLEPTIDYVVTKFPRWAFDKFPSVERKLGTQMKATGEVMGLERNLERSLLKAIHSLEMDVNDLKLPSLSSLTVDKLKNELLKQSDQRFFFILELLRKGISIKEIYDLTGIDLFFLQCFSHLVELEQEISHSSFDTVTKEQLQYWKEKGFSDIFIASEWGVTEKDIRNKRKAWSIVPVYKMVDTCAAEFEASSNYFYSTYFGENEQIHTDKRKVAIIGSGPIRIGQGIEFDYCSVHGVMALKNEKIETILINNNPETVSTDYTTADKLYFEPLIIENILDVIESEGVTDVIVQFGGQTSLNLAKELENYGITILGTNSHTIDLLEDRDLFYQLLDELNIPHIEGDIAYDEEQIKKLVLKLGYPVLIRPSYVIGGKGMEKINNETELAAYIETNDIPYPVLVDQFKVAREAELDLVSDGRNLSIPVIMEHIEKTGVHSGDSLSMLPAQTLTENAKAKMKHYAEKIVQKIGYKGLMNIQYIVNGDDVYLLEVNPRASRTVPIVSKVTGIPLVQIATKILLGKYNLSKELIENNINIPYVCVKYPVFSNYALNGLDSKVSPEMRSTGEGISIAENLNEAIRKAFHVALKKKEGNTIVLSTNEGLERLKKKTEKLGVNIVVAEDAEILLKDANTIGYYNPFADEKDKYFRSIATRNRVITFTEKESLEAFMASLEVKDFTVHSISEWHTMIKEDVNAI